MTVRKNITAVKDARAKVLAHCMCARFQEDRTHFTVFYPPGFRLDGCRVSKGLGIARALGTLAQKMELHWQGGV